ncbi:unnamed protein product [Linum trigynum]|uniref:Oxidoreductase-like domain-containing protein n=2 Tax=Linum trigynum TaxID=586398 RepID=A0AAV2FY21_9ROSI
MFPCTSPHPIIPHKRRHRPPIDLLQNARPDCSSAMRNFSRKAILSSFNTVQRHSLAISPGHPQMAATTTTIEAKRGGSIDDKEEQEQTKEKAIPPPPPPEKPEPGDCCGSGCVRCVWDVYYEELEDYNKTYPTG